MDFQLSREQADILKAAEEFARGEFDPDLAMDHDERQEYPAALWRKACELGFVGLHFPEESGGAGYGRVENALVAEAFCRRDSGIGISLSLADFGSELILRHGNENQKALLPRIAQGREIITVALLEGPYSLKELHTSARSTDGGYRIEGRKSFVPFGQLAGHLMVLCRNGGGRPAGQSIFLLEQGRPGMSARSMGRRLGMRMIPMEELEFAGVAAPQASVLGEPEQGARQVRGFLAEMRVEAGAMGVGIAQGAFDRSLEYGRRREQFGRPIVKYEAIRNKLADMCAEVELARLVVRKAAWSLDCGRPDSRAVVLAKLAGSKAAFRVASEAIQIHGGLGYMAEGQVERFYRDAKALDLFLEPSQVQRELLADLVIDSAG